MTRVVWWMQRWMSGCNVVECEWMGEWVSEWMSGCVGVGEWVSG